MHILVYSINNRTENSEPMNTLIKILVGLLVVAVGYLGQAQHSSNGGPSIMEESPETAAKTAALNPTISNAADAKEILNRYIEAIGGKEMVNGVESFTMTAEAEMQGQKLDLLMKKTADGKYMQDVMVDGNSMSKQVFDGEKGYMVMQGQRMEMGDEQLVQIKKEAVPFPELEYIDNPEIAVVGEETIDGSKAHVLQISPEKKAYYDMENGLKVQETITAEMNGQQMTSVISYKDYQEVSGIQFPFVLAQTVGPQSFEFRVKEIKVNEGVSDADFE